MPKISVIVPIYKAEKHIEQCVNSVLAQSFTDFELILVDDCSPDNSGERCDNYKDERVIVIHLSENGGPANARNIGMEKAKGDYFAFVDSDDYIENDMLEKAYSKAKDYDCDIVLFGFNSVVEINGIVKMTTKTSCKSCVLNSKKEIASTVIDLKRNDLIDTSCNKLYKVDTVRKSGVIMPKGEIFEDTEFNLRLLPYISRMVIMEECFYNYMQRNNSGSITKSYDKSKIRLLKDRNKTLIDYFKKVGCLDNEKIAMCNYFYIKYIFSSFIDLHFPASNLSFKEKKMFISEEINSSEFRNAISNCSIDSKVGKIIVLNARTKSPIILYFLSKAVYILKYQMQKVFFKFKSKNI